MSGKRLRVNPITCDGRSLCAELFPERVRSDDWGYPIIDERPIPPQLMPAARRLRGRESGSLSHSAR